MQQIDLGGLGKPELRERLGAALQEVEALRGSVDRLLRQASRPSVLRHSGHPDDFVPAGWAERHGIQIPRASGVFQSDEAWVRVEHGVIVGAGLNNQSILCLAISLGKLDQGAEHHGNLYKDWRAAFLARVDPSRSGGGGSDTPDAWSKEDRYSKLQRRVEQDHIAAMDCIVASRPKARHLAAFQANQAGFVAAFKTVARTMADIDREAEEALEKLRKKISV